jgi:ribosomal protein L37AE/L43A
VTDVRKLLARLNPRQSQYEIGSGGIPELTPQDIAAGLGMVRDVLGREILCHVWWPDGAKLTHQQLLDAMRDLQLGEWTLRMRRLEAANLAYHIACEVADGTHGRARGQITRARAEVEDAKGAMWPRIGPQSRYLAIREGVLAEMLDPHLCPTCGGSGEVRADAVVRVCGRCLGSGHDKATDTDRAARIGCTRQAYVGAWGPPYEWLLDMCAHAERAGARQLAYALEIAG